MNTEQHSIVMTISAIYMYIHSFHIISWRRISWTPHQKRHLSGEHESFQDGPAESMSCTSWAVRGKASTLQRVALSFQDSSSPVYGTPLDRSGLVSQGGTRSVACLRQTPDTVALGCSSWKQLDLAAVTEFYQLSYLRNIKQACLCCDQEDVSVYLSSTVGLSNTVSKNRARKLAEFKKTMSLEGLLWLCRVPGMFYLYQKDTTAPT